MSTLRTLRLAFSISIPLTAAAAVFGYSAERVMIPAARQDRAAIAEPSSAIPRAPLNCATRRAEDDGLVCLACNVYHEARGEDTAGQMSVARVTINRMRDRRYPKTLCGVVWQRIPGTRTGEFSWTTEASPVVRDARAWAKALDVAGRVITEAASHASPASTRAALRYHSTDVKPHWPGYHAVARVGRHVFYAQNG